MTPQINQTHKYSINRIKRTKNRTHNFFHFKEKSSKTNQDETLSFNKKRLYSFKFIKKHLVLVNI